MDERQLKKRDLINDFFTHISTKLSDLEKNYIRKHKIMDLSSGELHILDIASSLKLPTMGEVAHHVHLTNGTVTTAVKRLERKGYLVRVKDGVDRRLSRVQLTNKGNDVVALHLEFYEKMEKALADSTVDDQQLLDVMHRLTVCFDQIGERLL